MLNLIIGQFGKQVPPRHNDFSGWRQHSLKLTRTNNKDLKFGLDKMLRWAADNGLTPSELAIDFAVFALMVHAADTKISRLENSDDAWTRVLGLQVPVSDPNKWESVREKWMVILNFLTGDRWYLRFVARPRRFRNLSFEANNVELDVTAVSLLSGGLDSAIGAIDVLMEGERPIFISHRAHPHDATPQDKLVTFLKSGFPDVEIPHFSIGQMVNSTALPGSGNETSTRSRSIWFFSLASFVAECFEGPIEIYVPENGFISINPPLDLFRLGAHSTRTTHPYIISSVNAIYEELGFSGVLKNPYQYNTKGEMLKYCQNRSLIKKIAFHTESCSHINSPWNGIREHCGYCTPCLIRQAAFLKAYGVNGDRTIYSNGPTVKKHYKADSKPGQSIRSFLLAAALLANDKRECKKAIRKIGPIPRQYDFPALVEVVNRGVKEVRQLLRSVDVDAG